ncbi:MAG: hypothetical protein AB8B74_11075 [Crocinitomicaceae bacterium]
MKKLSLFIGFLGAFSIGMAQNYLPHTGAVLGGPVVFGLAAPVSNSLNFQIHGVDDYCFDLIGEPELPFGPESELACAGLSSLFTMTNPVTGTNTTDGMLFRMSALNFVMQNQEGKNIDIKSGGSKLRLDGAGKNAWFGSPSTSLAGTHVAAVNVFPNYNANGMLIKTLGSSAVGLTVKGGSDDNIAIQVVKGTTGATNFVVQGSGFVFARKYTTTLASIPDYVFKPDYDLMPLSDLRNYITKNQHLPNIPSAKEYEETGVDLGELNRLLLEKVEELTLYTLQLEERMKKLEEK